MSSPGAAIITGGSSGIGLELARGLAAKGHGLALIARDAGRLQDAVRLLKADFPDILITAYPADVADQARVDIAVQAAIRDHDPPKWAIANAGVAEPGLFVDQSLETFHHHMNVNYMGALYFAKSVVEQMKISGGHLVFVSSGAAFFGIYGYSAYAPPKFAMRGLAEVLRVELGPHDISVTLAYPPDTDTPMLAQENKTKPNATKAITAGGGEWTATDVANLILRRARRGKFTVAPGLQMRLLLNLHSVIAPVLRHWQNGVIKKHTDKA